MSFHVFLLLLAWFVGPNIELSRPVSSLSLAFGGNNFQTSWPIPYRVRKHRQSRISSEIRAVRVGVPRFFAALGSNFELLRPVSS